MSFLVLGIIIGLFMSTLNRIFSLKDVIGFAFLAVVGVFYGNLLAQVLEYSLNQPLPYFQPLLIIIGSLSLTSLKIIFLTRSQYKQSHKITQTLVPQQRLV